MNEESSAERPPLPDPPLGGLETFLLLALAGALLGHLCVWLGCSLRDGGSLLDGGAQVLAKKLLGQAWWRLPAILLMGWLLRRFYDALLRPGPQVKVGPVLWGIPRAFIHFALYGLIALVGVILAFVLIGVRRWVLRRPEPPAEDGPSLVERWLGVPVWFIILPLAVGGLKNEGDMTLPVTVPRRALLRWLPAACLAIYFFWTRATSEDTGEYVDPLWLCAFASFWLAELLVVALRVTPILRARRGLAP